MTSVEPEPSPLTPGLLHAARRLLEAHPVSAAAARKLAEEMYPRAEPSVIDQVIDLWRQQDTDNVVPDLAHAAVVPID